MHPCLAAGEPDSSPCITELRRDPGIFFAGADTDIRTVAFFYDLFYSLSPFSFYLTPLCGNFYFSPRHEKYVFIRRRREMRRRTGSGYRNCVERGVKSSAFRVTSRDGCRAKCIHNLYTEYHACPSNDRFFRLIFWVNFSAAKMSSGGTPSFITSFQFSHRISF